MAQLVRAPPCHGGGRGFESLLGRRYRFIYNALIVCRNDIVFTETSGILAQLGEHLPYKQRVTGSSPVGPILLKVSIKYGEVAQLARAYGSYPGG